jgi:hypothetical protein
VQKKARATTEYGAEAHKRARQLRQALVGLIQTPDEKNATWHDLAYDADCIERRLRGALNAMNQILTQDPAIYTTPLPADYRPQARHPTEALEHEPILVNNLRGQGPTARSPDRHRAVARRTPQGFAPRR